MRLNEFFLQYHPRPSIKAQVLADFIIECTVPDDKFDHKFDGKSEQVETSEAEPESVWMLHIDRTSNAQGNGVSLILTNSKRTVIEYAFWFNFKASNNQAKYEALLVSLKIVKGLGIDNLKVFTDSQLIIE